MKINKKYILSQLIEIQKFLKSDDTKILRKFSDGYTEIDKRAGSKINYLDTLIFEMESELSKS